MSLLSSLVHKMRGCRIGDLSPYLYTARELGYDSYDEVQKYARCRVCRTLHPVPK